MQTRCEDCKKRCVCHACPLHNQCRYCSACGKWQKWLKKDEIRLFNHGVKVENASLLERLKARIEESAIKVSTVKAPHTYMKAVGTRELEKILEEELGNEDTK